MQDERDQRRSEGKSIPGRGDVKCKDSGEKEGACRVQMKGGQVGTQEDWGKKEKEPGFAGRGTFDFFLKSFGKQLKSLKQKNDRIQKH